MCYEALGDSLRMRAAGTVYVSVGLTGAGKMKVVCNFALGISDFLVNYIMVHRSRSL